MWIFTRNTVAVLALAAAVCGCGSGQDSSATRAAAKAARKAAAQPADALSRNMVAAVTSVKPGSSPLPIQVKFELGQRPEVAQPLDVNLAIVPLTPNLDRIYGKVEGEEGLEVVDSAELTGLEKPVEGVPIQQVFKVLAKTDGIYTLTATISGVDSAGQVATQAYVIPIIAGRGFPDLPVKPATTTAPAAKTAAAQPAASATR
jgi:hypothetical protein